MFKTRQITEASLLCSVSAILQLIPVLFSDVFTIFTLLSTIPIYIITRKDYKLGIVSFSVTSVILLTFHLQEFVIFVFLNGFIGCIFGILDYFLKRKYLVKIITGINLSLSITFLNFIIGIPLFGFIMEFSLIIFVGIILFSMVYCTIYHYVLNLFIKISVIKNYLNRH